MNVSAPPKTPLSTRPRPALFMLISVFGIPLLAAAVLLNTGWYQFMGTSNRGVLITPPLSLQQLLNTDDATQIVPRQWQLLFIMPQVCELECQNSLYLLDQIILAMGPEKHRLGKHVLIPYDREAINHALESVLALPLRPAEASHLFLVDPDGKIFMHYPGHSDRRQTFLQGRDIVNDLKHAMKLSRIG